jgi:hypothetical protein
MNYQFCPHYNEMISVLSEGRDFEDINFEIDEIEDCEYCSIDGGVCSLWIGLTFVEDVKPQMNISEAKVTIDNLEEQMKIIAMRLLSGVEPKNDEGKELDIS